MITWLNIWLQNDNTKIIYILVLILTANMIDFLMGWINAKFNKEVEFSSSKAILGIARKMMMFILCVLFIPISLLVPSVGIVALYVMLLGYLLSELNSILNHLKLAKDDKSVDVFLDFLQKLFGKGKQ